MQTQSVTVHFCNILNILSVYSYSFAVIFTYVNEGHKNADFIE